MPSLSQYISRYVVNIWRLPNIFTKQYLWIWYIHLTWENHHCEKHGNTQISPNLSHKLWKRLVPGMPGWSYQTKPGLPSGCQVNIECFYAKSTCHGSNYRNISSLTLVQKVIPEYLPSSQSSVTLFWLVASALANSVSLCSLNLVPFMAL
jgi:hypothetical protein